MDDNDGGPPPSSVPPRPPDAIDWSRPVDPRLVVVTPEAEPDLPTPAKERRPRWWPTAALAGGSALLGAVVGGVIVAAVVGSGDDSPTTSSDRAAVQSLRVEQSSAVSDVAQRARPSVIRIESTRRTASGLEQDVGSGIVLDAEGHVITNAHVVLGTETLKAILPDGSERPAILLGNDYPFTDLAVLQLGPGGLRPVEIGDSDALALGETVVAVGNPLAEFDGSVTVGVVSGLNRHRTFDAVRQDGLIQTDAAVNNGNSGGGLFNLKGQFVGMPTSIIRQSRNSQVVEGIAFALPANRLLPIARKIISDGEYPRPTLGLDHFDLGSDASVRVPRLAVDEGALVTAVVREGPAEAAGIAVGDVITRLGDRPVDRNTLLLNALQAFQPGQAVKVVLNRNGRIIETEVRLGKRS